jgi:hypothetical protein
VLCTNFQNALAVRVKRPTSKEYLGGGKIVRELWKEIGNLIKRPIKVGKG